MKKIREEKNLPYYGIERIQTCINQDLLHIWLLVQTNPKWPIKQLTYWL